MSSNYAVDQAREHLARCEREFDAARGNLERSVGSTSAVDLERLNTDFDIAKRALTLAGEQLQRAEKDERALANAKVGPDGSIAVTGEPVTYTREAQRTKSYFRDLLAVELDKQGHSIPGCDAVAARDRLRQHDREIRGWAEQRDRAAERRMSDELHQMLDGLPDHLTREIQARGMVEKRAMSRVDGAGGHFVPPIWLMDLYAPLPRAGRPFVEECRQIDLPAGTDSINVPRITTGSLTGVQTADNAAIAAQDMVDAVVTLPVRAIAGQVDIALQALEQSPVAFDEIIFGDLIADYYLRCEDQALNGSGAAGQVLGTRNTAGIATTTYTDATPTVPELWPKLAGNLSTVRAARKQPITNGWITPQRYYWLCSALDTQNRPWVVPDYAGPNNAIGTFLVADGADMPVRILGVTHRVTDMIPINLGTGVNEDVIIHTRNEDHVWFESDIRARALMEPLSSSLGVRLQVYSYVAFTAGRLPAATGLVAGTGLTQPLF